MPDVHYEDPRLARLYDIDSGWSIDRQFYVDLAGESPQRILDLGCGTGLICQAYAAKGHDVTGVDPAAAMLDIARERPLGHKVDWIQSSSESFRSAKSFDLVIMTGHAFQVLLDAETIHKTLSGVQQHLAKGGRFVFESRNPDLDWLSRWDGATADFALGTEIVHQSRRVVTVTHDRIVFDTVYTFDNDRRTSRSELLFLSKELIGEHVLGAGLEIENLFGDWGGSAFDAATSEEMIFICRHPN